MTHPLFRNSAAHADGFRDVDPQVLHAHLGEVPIIDVREPSEFTGELGHIPGATLVPLATLESAAKEWDREKDVVIVCRSGGRSAKASRQLVELGFTRVMNMRGGMLAYNAANLPVVTT
jgi:sulfur-carrier protein adenylyltransferase/sulfurtransferase